MYWLNKLEELLTNGADDKFFQSFTYPEQIRYCVMMTWNNEYGRHDKFTFDKREIILDPKGSNDQQPPVLIAKTLCSKNKEVVEKALSNLKQLLNIDE
jgi:hypothetical protein